MTIKSNLFNILITGAIILNSTQPLAKNRSNTESTKEIGYNIEGVLEQMQWSVNEIDEWKLKNISTRKNINDIFSNYSPSPSNFKHASKAENSYETTKDRIDNHLDMYNNRTSKYYAKDLVDPICITEKFSKIKPCLEKEIIIHPEYYEKYYKFPELSVVYDSSEITNFPKEYLKQKELAYQEYRLKFEKKREIRKDKKKKETQDYYDKYNGVIQYNITNQRTDLVGTLSLKDSEMCIKQIIEENTKIQSVKEESKKQIETQAFNNSNHQCIGKKIHYYSFENYCKLYELDCPDFKEFGIFNKQKSGEPSNLEFTGFNNVKEYKIKRELSVTNKTTNSKIEKIIKNKENEANETNKTNKTLVKKLLFYQCLSAFNSEFITFKNNKPKELVKISAAYFKASKNGENSEKASQKQQKLVNRTSGFNANAKKIGHTGNSKKMIEMGIDDNILLKRIEKLAILKSKEDILLGIERQLKIPFNNAKRLFKAKVQDKADTYNKQCEGVSGYKKVFDNFCGIQQNSKTGICIDKEMFKVKGSNNNKTLTINEIGTESGIVNYFTKKW